MFETVDQRIQPLLFPVGQDPRMLLISDTFISTLQAFKGAGLEGTILQQRDACLDAMYYASNLNGENCLDQLFETGYCYGVSASGLNLASELEIPLRDACLSIVYEKLGGIIEINNEGQAYLPELPISELFKNNSELEVDLFEALALGIASGVSLRDIATLPATITNSKDLLAKINPNLLSLRKELINLCPDLLCRLFDDATTYEELEFQQNVIRELLPQYNKERIEPIILAKKKGKISGRMNYDDWSVNSVNLKESQALELLKKKSRSQGSPTEVALFLNKVIFQTADELARVSLFKDVLYRDLDSVSNSRQIYSFDPETGRRSVKGEIKTDMPREVYALIDGFLLDAIAKGDLSFRGDLAQDFSRFLINQVQGKTVVRRVESYMLDTAYWKESKRRQIVTPDTYSISDEQRDLMQEIDIQYRKYMMVLNGVYATALDYPNDIQSASLIRKLEGGLPEQSLPILREVSRLMLGREVDSLRFDLIPSGNNYFVGEAQIISGGTPPAILYREGFNQAGIDQAGLIGDGILKPFLERLYSQSGSPVLAILYSERPYSSDISKTTSFAGNSSFEAILEENGVAVQTVFAKDIEQRSDGRWYFKEGKYADRPITTVYNRTDIVSDKGGINLQDEEFLALTFAMASGGVDAFPPPIPILFGKGIYAALFDSEFETFLLQSMTVTELDFLRQVTPYTMWINEATDMRSINPEEWIRKGAYQHATQGLIMGPDQPEYLIEQIAQDKTKPYSAVLQRYVDSDQPLFRVPMKFKIGAEKSAKVLVAKPFRLRVEPTSIGGKIVEVFVTGNEDRIVHGRSTSIMTVASIKNNKL